MAHNPKYYIQKIPVRPCEGLTPKGPLKTHLLIRHNRTLPHRAPPHRKPRPGCRSFQILAQLFRCVGELPIGGPGHPTEKTTKPVQWKGNTWGAREGGKCLRVRLYKRQVPSPEGCLVLGESTECIKLLVVLQPGLAFGFTSPEEKHGVAIWPTDPTAGRGYAARGCPPGRGGQVHKEIFYVR